MTRLIHGRVELALHSLAEGDGPILLCLHALRASSDAWRTAASGWPGPVRALDFSGHGASGPLRGDAFSAEMLAGDADAALAACGPAYLAGFGLGGYVALLLAGSRPDLVPGILIARGAGEGGGALPRFDDLRALGSDPSDDPLDFLENDVRPVDYAGAFGAETRRLVCVEDGATPPPWWEAARDACPESEVAPNLPAGLAQLARTGNGSA